MKDSVFSMKPTEIRLGGDSMRHCFEEGRRYEQTRAELFKEFKGIHEAASDLSLSLSSSLPRNLKERRAYFKSIIRTHMEKAQKAYSTLEDIFQAYSKFTKLRADFSYIEQEYARITREPAKCFPHTKDQQEKKPPIKRAKRYIHIS